MMSPSRPGHDDPRVSPRGGGNDEKSSSSRYKPFNVFWRWEREHDHFNAKIPSRIVGEVINLAHISNRLHRTSIRVRRILQQVTGLCLPKNLFPEIS